MYIYILRLIVKDREDSHFKWNIIVPFCMFSLSETITHEGVQIQ